MLLSYFTALLFIPSTKFFFILAFFLVFALFFVFKSAHQALFFSFIPVSIIGLGQQYFFQVIPPEAIINIGYPDGRFLYYSLSPSLIIGLCIVCFLILNNLVWLVGGYKNGRKSRSAYSLCQALGIGLLLFFTLFSFISSSRSISYPVLSLLYSLGDFLFLSWIISGIFIFNTAFKDNAKSVVQFIRLLALLFIVISTFLSGITLSQAILRSSLGLKIEMRQNAPQFGYGSDENALQFRPVGLNTHANNNAADLLVYLTTSVFLFLVLTKHKENIFSLDMHVFLLVLPVIAVLQTQSRAAYIALMVLFFTLGIVYFRPMKVYVTQTFQRLMNARYVRIFIYIFTFLLFFIVFDRLWYSTFSFSPSGGFSVRDELFKEAIALFRANSYFGVGNGMFIPSLFNFNPTGIVARFPESVHNGFILVLTERGLLAITSILLFAIFLLRNFLSSFFSNNSSLSAQLIFFHLSLSVVMLFHPITLLVTPLTLLSLLFFDMDLERSYK